MRVPNLKRKEIGTLCQSSRLAREHERFANLDRMRYIFDAYFGKEAAKPFEVVDEIYADIVSSAETLIQIASANPTRQDREDEMPLPTYWVGDHGSGRMR
jgi:hypothetical protein